MNSGGGLHKIVSKLVFGSEISLVFENKFYNNIVIHALDNTRPEFDCWIFRDEK